MPAEQVTGYAAPADGAQLGAVAARLRERNFEVLVVGTAAEARDAVLALLPDGAEVHSGKSKTLEDAGILGDLMQSGRHNFLRKRLFQMDRQTQAGEIRKLGAAPDIMLGSVQAITEAGQLVAASASGASTPIRSTGASARLR